MKEITKTIAGHESGMYYLNIVCDSHRKLPPSLTAVTVSPALVLPKPVVIIDLWLSFAAYLRNCDLPVPVTYDAARASEAGMILLHLLSIESPGKNHCHLRSRTCN